MKKYYFTIDYDLEGERLDKGISILVGNDFSRSFLQKIIKDGQVQINNNIVSKASYNLKLDDNIELTLPDSATPDILPEDIALDIIYEDDDVIIVNKPKDMVVHPANGHFTGTLVNALLYHCKDSLSGINGVMRPGIVHRIDKDTTGSIIACKNDNAHRSIAAQLAEHSINRRYLAICEGVLKEDEYIIDAPIGRSEKDRKKMAINYKNGKNAVTHVKVLERFNNSTLVECKLETGRTHQIRVHLASIKHPLLGDEVYNSGKNKFKLKGQALHAYILGFEHPTTHEYIETKAPIPTYFSELIEKNRKI